MTTSRILNSYYDGRKIDGIDSTTLSSAGKL